MKLPKLSFDLRNLSPSRLVGFGSVMMSVALVAALVLGSIGDKGRPSVKVSLTTGSAWFASPDLGTAALVDGTTVTRVADIPVFPSDHNIEVVQAGSGAEVLDHSTGQGRYIDGATLAPSSPVVLGLPNDSHLALRSTGDVTWALERGGTAAQQLDPQTLIAVGPPVPLADPVASAVIGTDGTLWVVDGSSLRSVQGTRIRTSLQLAGGTAPQVVMASGHPVVVDPVDHRAVEINPASGKSSHSGCFESTDPAALLSGSDSGSPEVFAVSPETGTLQISDLGKGTCREVFVGPQSSVDRYGRSVESNGWVYIPDYATGTVVVVDARSGRVLGRPLVSTSTSAFSLLNYHGFVWFDDAKVDVAGIVTLNGGIAVSTAGGDPRGEKVGARKLQAPGHPVNTPAPPPVGGPTTPTQPSGAQTNTPPSGPPPPGSSTANQTQAGAPTGGISGGGQNPPPPPPPTRPPPPPPHKPPPPPPPPAHKPPPPPPPPPLVLTPSFSASANPAVVNTSVTFTDTTPQPHTIVNWTFPGGNPPTSTAKTVTVTWAVANTYPVTLTVQHNGSAKSLSQPEQIIPPADVTVPNVIGMTVAAATTALDQAGLTVGTQTPVNSFVLKGNVGSTNPAGGAPAPKGTAVNLGISVQTGTISSYASVTTPGRLAIDGSGNIYLATYAASEVLKVTPSTSGPATVTVVAGNGTSGSSGDGGAATSAELNTPNTVAVDAAGDLFIGELGNHDIREVNTQGIISTVATITTSPIGDLKYFNNTLYAVLRGLCTVDSVDLSNGTFTPVVGTPGSCSNGPTTLFDPASVTFDSSGAMYIAEPGGALVRKFANGTLTTVAGSGVTGYAGDGGPATSAKLSSPDEVAFDGLGDLFITDWGNCAVREVTPDGTIATVAGTGVCGNTPGEPANVAQLHNGGNGAYSSGLAVDGAGNIFVADTNNNRIAEIAIGGP